MFIRSPISLLNSLRFALSNPFDLKAQAELESGPFKCPSAGRDDLVALRALCLAYDQARLNLSSHIMRIRLDLEDNYTFRIPVGTVPCGFSRVEVNAPALSQHDKVMVGGMIRHECAQRQTDRIFDHLKIQSRGDKNPVLDSTLLRLMSFYLLNEALCLALAGVAQVEEVSPGRFKLKPRDTAQVEMLKCLWFSKVTSNGSFASTILYAKKLSDSHLIFKRDEIEKFVEYFMDKEFWVLWKSIPQQGTSLKTVIHMRRVSELVALLLIAQLKGQVVECSQFELAKIDIDISLVLEVLGRQAKLLVTDHFVERNTHNELVLHIDSMTTGLRNYIVQYAKEHQDTEQLKLVVGGIFFEKKTITDRLRSDAKYSSRYNVYDGFTRHDVEVVENKADVDLIIFDKVLCQYYFVQVKHAARGGLAYFEGDAKCLDNDLEKGLNQLREARSLLENGHIKAQLEARGVCTASPQNSHFVLVHNLERFDYQITSDGVALYEWSTFRNLLLNCRIVSSSVSSLGVELHMPRDIPINNPVSLVDTLLSEHPALSEVKGTALLMKDVSTNYSVEGVEVTLVALGL